MELELAFSGNHKTVELSSTRVELSKVVAGPVGHESALSGGMEFDPLISLLFLVVFVGRIFEFQKKKKESLNWSIN